MADYERSERGGRGGQYNNRKRRYRDEDDFDRRPQRRRYEEPWVVKVRKQLLSVAESPLKRVEDEISTIAKIVTENYEDVELRNNFCDLLLQLVIEQPFKIPFAAAIILVANPQKPEITTEILKKAGNIAQAHIEAGAWREFKLVLRFLGCLQGLYEESGVFPLLEELFNRAVDLQTASSEDAMGLELVKIILVTIPYVLASSATGLEDLASNLLEKTDIIASTPHALETLVDPYPSSDPSKPGQSESVIGLLQKQLQSEASRGWPLACIPRSWKMHLEEDAADPLASAPKHDFPTITVPQSVNPGPKTMLPEMYISVYSEQDVITVPPTTDIASSILRDSIVDTINILDFNRIATARYLIDVDCYFSPDTFVKRATPFDKLKEIPEGKSTWKPEDVAVDAVFSQLFQLPVPEHKLVYYHSVLTEACKIAPAAIAPSLGRAIRYLYKNVISMDMELAYRFIDWFSHHLSNFGFTWKWTEWIDDVELPDVHPKKAFIMGALEKEVRLSFAQRIRGTLPEPYQPLVSESKEKDAPDFKYDSDQTPYAQEGRELLALLRKKSSEDEIQSVINTIHAKAATLGVADTLVPSTDAYVTAICHLGSKSLSHVLSCIERCKDRLLAIGAQSPTAARRQIISSVMEYWHDQPGVGVNIVDKLLNYTILTPLSVVEWVLIDHLGGGKILAQSHIYEMVATTVHKVTKRLRDILAARRRPGLSDAEVKVLDETVDRERPELGNLFRVIEDALVGVAAGVTDEELEAGAMDADEGKLEAEFLKAWGQSWLRVFRRVFAVEEAAAQVVEEQAQRLATQGKKDGIEGMAVADGNENGLENGDVEGGPVGMGIE